MKKVPVAFGHKMCWLAIRNATAGQLVKDLELINPCPSGWQEGIEAVYLDAQKDIMKHLVFLSPQVSSWTFVIGYSLPTVESESVQILFDLLSYLSDKYEEVCSFGTNRVSEYHHWIKFEKGSIVRAFAISEGEILINKGDITPPESFIDFEMILKLQSPDFTGDIDFNCLPDEQTVLRVAENWSLNPAKLEQFESSGEGFLGKIAKDQECSNIPTSIKDSYYPDNSSLLEKFKLFFFK